MPSRTRFRRVIDGGIPFNYKFNNMRLWVGARGKDKSSFKVPITDSGVTYSGEDIVINGGTKRLSFNSSSINTPTLTAITHAFWEYGYDNTSHLSVAIESSPTWTTNVGGTVIHTNYSADVNARLIYGFKVSTNTDTRTVASGLWYNKWQHIIVSHDFITGSVSVYYNGIKKTVAGTIPINASLVSNNTTSIGGRLDGSLPTGMVSDIRIYDFAFTPKDVANLWSAVKGTHAY